MRRVCYTEQKKGAWTEMKRVLTVQDLSCVGKCALAVALPVLSVMGVEACPLPTAVLSAHTMFPDVAIRDLTEEMPRFSAHWQAQKIRFDAICTGYLASVRQVELTAELFRTFGGEDVRIIVDPAMAEGGALYTGFSPDFPDKIAALCAQADVITPNITEAALLTHRPYPGEDCGAETAMAFARELTEMGPACAVVTGVRFPDGRIGAVGYDRKTGNGFEKAAERVGGKYHATGDLFSAALTGAVARGLSTERAVSLAADFVCECLRRTPPEREDAYGPCFETALPWLADELQTR